MFTVCPSCNFAPLFKNYAKIWRMMGGAHLSLAVSIEKARAIYSDQTETFYWKKTRSESLGGSKRTARTRQNRSCALPARQDAELSQRDRAAGCVIFGQTWKTGTERQYFMDIIGLSSIRYQLCVGHASGSCDNCDLSGRRWRRTRRKRLYMPSSAAALTTVTACSTALVTVCWRSYKLLGWWRAHASSTTSLRCSVTFIGCQFARGLSTSSPWQYTNAGMDWRQLTWSTTFMQFPLSPASE